MAWHIFKKDLVLLWPLALLSALAQFGLFGLAFAMDATPQATYLRPLAQLSVPVVLLAIFLAIALGVQQEPIPGTRQDWLARPIRRRDLLLAKLLFVLVAVHAPMLLGDTVGAMARGFSVGEAVGAALARSLLLFVTLSLPALAFAAMTRTVGQFVGAGIAYFIAVVAVMIVLSVAARLAGQEQATNPLAWSGVGWIPQTAGRIALATGSAVAVLLLYLRRRVTLARGLFPAFALLSALTAILPWSWIFAVQQAAAATASPATVTFDPAAPRYRPAPGESADVYAPGAAQVKLRGRAAGDVPAETQARKAQGDVAIYAPLRIAGLPAGARPWIDRAVVRLEDAGGRVLFEGRGDDFKQPSGAPAPGGVLGYEAIRVPGLVYQQAKEQPLTLEVEVSLSVLEPQPMQAIAALGADARLLGFGRCTSGRDSDGDEIELRCLTPANPPSCLTAALDDPATGRRNPEVLSCAPNYAPYATRSFPDVFSRYEVEAPFRDRLGIGSYPVDADRLAQARVVVTRYEASAHLVRRVTAGPVRLSDWTAAANGKSLRP
jgi:ABC-type transport system involved in multi-copper enzyme maturation permease subunit